MGAENVNENSDESPSEEENIEIGDREESFIGEFRPVAKNISQGMESSAREVGEGVGEATLTVTKFINTALKPLGYLVWGYEAIETYLRDRLSEKLKDVPPEQLGPPEPNIAGPAIEALRFVGQKPLLQELFANLIATSMDQNNQNIAHPAYVGIIKELTSDEARILKMFATVLRESQSGGLNLSAPVISIRGVSREGDRKGYSVYLKNFFNNCRSSWV